MRALRSILFLSSGLFGASPAFAACACGPDFCQDNPRIPNLLKRKKAALAQEYPDRLVALLDRGPQCVARIERSPDVFHLWVVHKNNDKETTSWSAENQANAMKQVRSGDLKRFWLIHAKRAFSCCGEASYDEMPDYDREDDVNASRAIRCDNGNPC